MSLNVTFWPEFLSDKIDEAFAKFELSSKKIGQFFFESECSQKCTNHVAFLDCKYNNLGNPPKWYFSISSFFWFLFVNFIGLLFVFLFSLSGFEGQGRLLFQEVRTPTGCFSTPPSHRPGQLGFGVSRHPMPLAHWVNSTPLAPMHRVPENGIFKARVGHKTDRRGSGPPVDFGRHPARTPPVVGKKQPVPRCVARQSQRVQSPGTRERAGPPAAPGCAPPSAPSAAGFAPGRWAAGSAAPCTAAGAGGRAGPRGHGVPWVGGVGRRRKLIKNYYLFEDQKELRE